MFIVLCELGSTREKYIQIQKRCHRRHCVPLYGTVRPSSCLVFMVVNLGVIRPLAGEISGPYLTAGDSQGPPDGRTLGGQCGHDGDGAVTGSVVQSERAPQSDTP